MGERWKIATIRGIPLYVSSSWFFVTALYVWLWYTGLTQGRPLLDSGEALTVSVLATILFFGSVLIHESAHAVMARSLGLPVTAITLVFWGGATETRANARGPLGEFLVAFVGPATTLALAGVFYVTSLVAHGLVADVLRALSGLSVIFAVINALPGFPLDGGRMLVAVVWGITRSRRTALRSAGYVGMAIGGAVAFAAVWSFTRDTGYWLLLGYLGFVMITTGRGMDARIALRDKLAMGTAADAMRQPSPAVPADMTLAQALDLHLRARPTDTFPVEDAEGHVIGTVSMSSARRPGARDPMRPVRDATIPLEQTPVLAPDETLDEVIEWIGPRQGIVLQDGRLVGAIDASDIERWFRHVIEGRPAMSADPSWVPPRPDR
jgi:Zn-dependent protease